MRAPRILIPMRQDARKTLPIQFVHEAHVDALISLGALPVPVPSLATLAAAVDEILAEADGLLLVEGGDVAPAHNPTRDDLMDRLKELDPEKDALEMALVARAIEMGLPTLGTCRGAQVVNVVAGGTLYSHLPAELGTAVTHVDGARYDELRHTITVRAGTTLSEIYSETEIHVTSVHHQGVRDLAPGFVINAHSPDGLIEGFSAPDHPFLLGVQHHPERQFDEHPGHLALYRALVDAARVQMK
jgi:putative glutamine amidotransferase